MPALHGCAFLERPALPRSGPYRIAIIASHPIQYHAHWFRSLAEHPHLDVRVLFGHVATALDQGRSGFARDFEWDVPLLEGYPHQFLRNTARHAGPGRFWGINTPEVVSVIRRGRFDAVILLGWQHVSDWQAILGCWMSGTPALVRGDSNLRMHRSLAKRALKRVIHGTCIPRFHACLAVGSWSEEYFRYYGARRIYRAPHSIDHGHFSPTVTPALRDEARAAFGLPSQSTVFLFAGKLIEQKRPLDFVQGVHAAASRGLPVHGLLVGDGPLKAHVAQYAQQMNAPVQFAGFRNQSEIIHAYHASDVLVLPSDGRETWGLVINEAMASGLPCLVSDHVGCGPDLILPGVTGDVFPLGSVEALAQLMVQYASNPSALQTMGDQAKLHEVRYSQKPSIEGVMSALEAVLNG
jgi:glycosyltransferase involved in cell wall biosynthesis